MNAALILSGGSGSRMGADRPKQFLPLRGVPILTRTVQNFCSHPEIDCVCVVCSADYLSETESALADVNTDKPVFCIAGGSTRQASAKNGLEAFAAQSPMPDIVLIHDAARPLVPHEVISRCIGSTKMHGACTAVIPAQDTIAVTDEAGKIVSVPDRSTLCAVQTPQGFSFPLILNAHRTLPDSAIVTDDASVARHAGHNVFTVEGDKRNLKITTKEDLTFAEAML